MGASHRYAFGVLFCVPVSSDCGCLHLEPQFTRFLVGWNPAKVISTSAVVDDTFYRLCAEGRDLYSLSKNRVLSQLDRLTQWASNAGGKIRIGTEAWIISVGRELLTRS